jgi:hypothetical protein
LDAEARTRALLFVCGLAADRGDYLPPLPSAAALPSRKRPAAPPAPPPEPSLELLQRTFRDNCEGVPLTFITQQRVTFLSFPAGERVKDWKEALAAAEDAASVASAGGEEDTVVATQRRKGKLAPEPFSHRRRIFTLALYLRACEGAEGGEGDDGEGDGQWFERKREIFTGLRVRHYEAAHLPVIAAHITWASRTLLGGWLLLSISTEASAAAERLPDKAFKRLQAQLEEDVCTVAETLLAVEAPEAASIMPSLETYLVDSGARLLALLLTAPGGRAAGEPDVRGFVRALSQEVMDILEEDDTRAPARGAAELVCGCLVVDAAAADAPLAHLESHAAPRDCAVVRATSRFRAGAAAAGAAMCADHLSWLVFCATEFARRGGRYKKAVETVEVQHNGLFTKNQTAFR